MIFNTKLNIGDTIWYVSTREGCIVDTTITGVTIVHKPFRPDIQTSVVYESNDNCNFAEENEGKYWWTTRKGILNYFTNALKSLENEKKSNPVSTKDLFTEIFDEFFAADHPSRSTQNLQNAFDDVYGKSKKPPVEDDFAIVLPPDLQRRLAKLKEGATKKTHCNCGHHRKSEIHRRARASAKNFLKAMKPLPGIREKTLTDYADEL